MEGVGVQTIEEFWGVELSSKKKKFEWMKEDEQDDLDELDLDRMLELRQGCLGASAKDGERNVVQITAEDDEGEMVKHTILSLRVGGTEQCALFLTLHPPVTFELVAGSGPVHIVGSSVESISDMYDDDSDSSEEGEVEVPSPEVKALLASATKKRPANSPASKPAKQIKLDKSSEESAVDTSMDTSGSLGVTKPSKRRVQEGEEDSEEEDSEEEDEDSEEEDDMSEEESEEEESEEEEVKPPTKKPHTNGKAKQRGQADLKSKMFKTPQPIKTAKQTKGTMSAPTTPKQVSEKKGGMKNMGQKKRKTFKSKH